VLSACADRDTNFSQYPGFAAYFAANPPAAEPPAAADRALLQRFRPRTWLPAGHEGPIDFYADYIAQGRLRAGDGAAIAAAVTPAILAAHKDDPRAVFEHVPSGAPPRPVVYARIDRENVRLPNDPAGVRPFVFLTYHLVFRVSCLPDGLAWWKALPVSLVASLEDWHQLDHYTAVTLVLDDASRPVAVTVQQHNYLRTWLVGREWPWPADDRIAIDVARRSNELYPHRSGRTRHRAVPFLDGDSVDYLVGNGGAPFFAGEDITDPVREIEAPLVFLAPADAFYTFKGFLGEKRLLPGRSGPPRRRLQHAAALQAARGAARRLPLARGRSALSRPRQAGRARRPGVGHRPPRRAVLRRMAMRDGTDRDGLRAVVSAARAPAQSFGRSMPRCTAGRASIAWYQRLAFGNSSSETPCHS